MQFESPLAFLLLGFLPLMLEPALLARLIGRKESQSTAIAFAPAIPLSSIGSSFRSRFATPLLSVLRAAAFVLFVIALARPQTGTAFTEVEASGRDIVLALDTSRSMSALDFSLNEKRVDRLTALQAVVKDFIDGRQGDRMGLVVFGEHAFTQCPLTLDHLVLKDFVDSLETGMAGNGTAVGDGLAVALKRIKNIESDSKVIVLVTDGKNNSGTLSPTEAAGLAKRLGVKVHTIGVGSEGLAPFPVDTPFGQRIVRRELEFDEKTLKEIASITSGQYFNAKDTDGLWRVYQELNKLEARKEQTLQFVEYDEHFLAPLIAGFLLLVIAEFLGATLFQQVP